MDRDRRAAWKNILDADPDHGAELPALGISATGVGHERGKAGELGQISLPNGQPIELRVLQGMYILTDVCAGLSGVESTSYPSRTTVEKKIPSQPRG